MSQQESFVVASKVKAAIKAAGFNTGSDVVDTVNAYVAWILDQAAKRAKENGRKTVRGHDVMIGE